MNSFVKFPLSIGCMFLLKRCYLIDKYKVRPGILSHFSYPKQKREVSFCETIIFY